MKPSLLPVAKPVENSTPDPIRLTPREKEVLACKLEGWNSKECADKLCCSKRTVDFHLQSIYDKIGASNLAQAVRKLTRAGVEF
jgi:DNA-binding CsgD family transcriptional regulator